ncbi:hypothetical protein L9F63_027587 [Diploptera punctata]|uniref:C2H2-type domain-containing protein n=1 Tax=Diploptera punctata TaxID=6984 RepID=A0AAD8A9H8_DIPPU|nr:hypothetical protein L9F63_027587 [Diploptera punctata]
MLWQEQLGESERTGIEPLDSILFYQPNEYQQSLKKSNQVGFREGGASRNKIQSQSSNEGFQCANCGKSYRWVNSLYKNLQLECGKEPQFHCPFCPHRAKRKWNLQTHIKVKHSQNK